jgi:dephospho-CoA kinase
MTQAAKHDSVERWPARPAAWPDAPAVPPAPVPAGDDAPETPVLQTAPAARAVVLVAGPWLLLLLIPGALACVMLTLEAWAAEGMWLLLVVGGLMLAALAVAGLELRAWRCTLTDRRVAASWGVVARASVEARLESVQRVQVTRSPAQRLLGLASVVMTTPGRAASILWPHLADADAALSLLRLHTERRLGVLPPAFDGAASMNPTEPPASRSPERPIERPMSGESRPASAASAAPVRGPLEHVPVIGLVGGIGAGKSTVARAFEALGCLVIDSDARAKAALDRPDVRNALVSWWGSGVLNGSGRVDRARVASIVFADPAQRARLEALVHPIVRQDRAQMIAEAAGRVRAVIVDAPLLFEAGVDAECDAVVFVDAPPERRLARVRDTRGWTPEELARREAAQMPLEEKRRRSNFVIDNAGGPEALGAQAAAVLDRLSPAPAGTASGGPEGPPETRS